MQHLAACQLLCMRAAERQSITVLHDGHSGRVSKVLTGLIVQSNRSKRVPAIAACRGITCEKMDHEVEKLGPHCLRSFILGGSSELVG